MPSFRFKRLAAMMVLSAGVGSVAALAQATPYAGLGRTPTKEDIGVLAIASGPSGKDLPPGNGTARQGAQIFMVKCAMCHGRDSEGVRAPAGTFSPLEGLRLGGGNSVPMWDTPRNPDGTPRITTLAWYSPWVTSIWNTIAVEMPFFRAGSLTPDEIYALTAFVLFKNGIVKEDDVMDRETLPKVKMPNHRNSFVPDEDKPDEILDIQKRGCFKTYGVCTTK
jgi:mono/diheme cytochrome c family protein